MKKSYLLTGGVILIIWLSASCGLFQNHNTDIHISENKDYYKLYASYDKLKSRELNAYINEKLDDNTFALSTGTTTDAYVMLDDKTNFYIKAYPGELEIKLDRQKNNEASYVRIRNMCEGIKDVLK